MGNLAPVALFVYNRPIHTQKVVEALLRNEEAKHSDLVIFSDASKKEEESEKVVQVRKYIKTISGFKSITIKEQRQNQGLAKSIIDGVTEIVNKFGKVIVLEDDIETSQYFLKFMNEMLNFYENEKRIWSVTGFSYPIKSRKIPEIFCFFAMSCWSWGTWADRWQHYDKNPEKYISQISKKDIYRFDYYNTTEMFSQITANKAKEINTWAIFWYAEQFVNNGFQIMPSKPLAKNIGMDGTGIHCGTNLFYNYDLYENEINIDFSKIPIEENKIATKVICNFFRKQKKIKNIIKQIIRKIFGKKIFTVLKLLLEGR
ncbi:MAG: glycosyltransferase [Spirochaetaceae bacterium]|nr:glycosyltransferase [Spirochaetaceae bacterium]